MVQHRVITLRVLEVGKRRHLHPVLAGHVERHSAAVAKIEAGQGGDERLGLGDALALRKLRHGVGGQCRPVHLGQIEHVVVAHKERSTLAAAGFVLAVGVTAFARLRYLPLHHGRPLFALADLAAHLPPLLVGRPKPGAVTGRVSRGPQHRHVHTPVAGLAGSIHRQPRRCPAVAPAVPGHPGLSLRQSRLDRRDDPIRHALIDVCPAFRRGRRSAGGPAPSRLFPFAAKQRLVARCFPGPRERWGWRGKSGFAGTLLHGAGAQRRRRKLGGRRFGGEKGQSPSAPLFRRVRGERARQGWKPNGRDAALQAARGKAREPGPKGETPNLLAVRLLCLAPCWLSSGIGEMKLRCAQPVQTVPGKRRHWDTCQRGRLRAGNLGRAGPRYNG